MHVDFEALSLTEFIRLQSDLVAAMNRRFQRQLVLAFSDVVGSTSYFARFGDMAGRALQQRHIETLSAVLPEAEGRIVDTAGDGAFLCFPRVDSAIAALSKAGNETVRANRKFPAEHRLTTRVGVHFGPALTDGVIVSGDSVNLCARIAATAGAGEMRLSREAFLELSTNYRARCRPLPAIELKGFAEPVSLMVFDWRERTNLPNAVLVRETNERFELPDRDTVTFGRLDEQHADGTRANDIVLRHPDAERTAKISRWHFELRRRDDALFCRSVTDGSTTVDGVELPKGSEVPVRNTTIIKVAGVLTLMLSNLQTDVTSDRHTSTLLG
jgi:class 3 adenylate cyclase